MKSIKSTVLQSIVLLGLSIAIGLAAGHANAQSFLRTEGHYIVNEQGEKVLLRGMGLGGWMLQEGYMLKLGNLGQQHVIRAKFEELAGKEATDEFYKTWLANHTTKADIDAMAQWGFNSVRLPMHFNLYTLPIEQEPVAGQNTWLEQGFAMTDQLIAWAKANNMYVILDLHAAPGGQGNDFAISDRNPNTPSLWQSEANQQKMIALWRKLAQRYVNEPTVGAYDIINEPNWGFENAADKNGCKETKNVPLKKLLQDVTKAIREVDNKHIVIIEGNCWGNNYAGVLPLWDKSEENKNLVLSFHKYWNNNTVADISGHLALREKYNIPIWLGESGENSNLWFTDAIELVESQGIGWAWWPLKKLGFNNPLEVKPNADYVKVVDYLNGKGEKPSPAFAKKALLQLAEDIRFENNYFHPEVIDAMFRQPYSHASVPYKIHRIKKSGSTVLAVDFDMGRSGVAYWDKDSANYHVATGKEHTLWNRGTTYRNEGVDIEFDVTKKSYVVNHFETDEWLEYTLHVDKEGTYELAVVAKASADGGKINVSVNNQNLNTDVNVPASQNYQSVTISGVKLLQGANKLRIYSKAGAYNLHSLVLHP